MALSRRRVIGAVQRRPVVMKGGTVSFGVNDHEGYTKPYVKELIEKGLNGFDPQTKQVQDPYLEFYNASPSVLTATFMHPVNPFYSFQRLCELAITNNALGLCIDALTVNIDSYGHMLEYIGPEGKESSGPATAEKARLEAFLEFVSPERSLQEVRVMARRDRETLGNCFYEVARNQRGEVVLFDAIPAVTMRITRKDPTPVDVEVDVPDPLHPGRYIAHKVKRYFRRFVQLTPTLQKVYFKEFGDPRPMNPATGDVDDTIPIEDQATECLWTDHYTPGFIYGLPRWIGQLPSVLGSRESEMVNLNFFRDNAIPAMAVLVSGGALTQNSYDVIKDYINAVRGQKAMNRVMVLEATVDDAMGSLDHSQPAPRVDMKPMISERQQDGLFQDYDEHNIRKIRSSFRLPPIFAGRCHSWDTEYLTDRSWLLWSDITDDCQLGTINPRNGVTEFQNFTARHSYEYKGSLVHLRNKGIDALITSNHRMFTRPTVAKSRNPKDWGFFNAGMLQLAAVGGNGGYIEIPVSSHGWSGVELTEFRLPHKLRANSRLLVAAEEVRPSKNPSRDRERAERQLERDLERTVEGDSFVKFIGYFVSEGSTDRNRRGVIALSQNPGRILNEMRDTLEDMGFDPSYNEDGRGGAGLVFCHSGLYDWLRENCGDGAARKRLPSGFVDLSRRQLLILLDAMIDGDGSVDHRGTPGNFSYTSISKTLIDQLQEICVKLGLASVVRIQAPPIENSHWSVKYTINAHVDTEHLLHPRRQVEHISYDGMVGCFTVPNGLLITRRNGRVLISGNSEDYTRASAYASMQVAESQVFLPARKEFDEIINRKIIGTYKPKYYRFKSLGPSVTDAAGLSSMVTALGNQGGLTPNIAIRLANEVLGVHVRPVQQEWGDYPFPLLVEYVRAGAILKGMEDFIEEFGTETQAPGGDQLGIPPKQPLPVSNLPSKPGTKKPVKPKPTAGKKPVKAPLPKKKPTSKVFLSALKAELQDSVREQMHDMAARMQDLWTERSQVFTAVEEEM